MLLSLAFVVGASTACSGAGATLPVQSSSVLLHCQLFHRQHESAQSPSGANPAVAGKTLDVRPNDTGEVSLAGLDLYAQYTSDEHDGTTFVIGARKSGAVLMKLRRQFDNAAPELKAFSANHGFTGLIYLPHASDGSEHQLYCGVKPLAPAEE